MNDQVVVVPTVDEVRITTSSDQEDLAGSMDHAAKRVLIILIAGFVLIALVAPWVML
jgi:hypothetical protein